MGEKTVSKFLKNEKLGDVIFESGRFQNLINLNTIISKKLRKRFFIHTPISIYSGTEADKF